MKKDTNKGVSLNDITEDMVEIPESLTEDDIIEEPSEQVIKPRVKKKKPLPLMIAIILGLVVFIGFSVYGYTQKQAKLEVLYTQAIEAFNAKNYEEAFDMFYDIQSYKDSKEMAEGCLEALNEGVYQKAMQFKEEGKYTEAIEELETIADYKDASKQITDCEKTRRRLYIEHIGVEVYKINKYKELAVAMCDVVSKDWKIAIDSGVDATVELQKTYNNWADNVRKLNIGSEGLKKQVEEIEELEGASEAFNRLNEIYSLYVKINEQALTPSGSHIDYIKKVADYSSEFDSLIEKLYAIEPEVKTTVANEVQKALEAELKQEQKVITQGNETGQ